MPKQRIKKIKNLSGFTLIELLIVIAIIGILASVVLVSLSNARTKAINTAVLKIMRSVMPIAQNCVMTGGYIRTRAYDGYPICCPTSNRCSAPGFDDGFNQLWPDVYSKYRFRSPAEDHADYYVVSLNTDAAETEVFCCVAQSCTRDSITIGYSQFAIIE